MTNKRYYEIDELLAYANGKLSTSEYYADIYNVGFAQRKNITQEEVGQYLAIRFQTPGFRLGGKWYE